MLRRPFLVLVILATLVSVGVSMPRTASASALCGPTVVAHRGGTERYVENTREAWNDSLMAGARVLETDVRFTSDGVPVVMHDESIDRTTDGTGDVAALTFAQVRQARTSDGQEVPTLYEYLSDGKKYGASYLIELKVRPTPAEWQALDVKFRWLRIKDRTTISSFDGTTVLEAKARGYRTALIDGLGYRSAASALTYGHSYVKHKWAVTYARAREWNAAGLAVYSWTDDTVDDWRRMSWDHVGYVITDKPAAMLDWERGGCR